MVSLCYASVSESSVDCLVRDVMRDESALIRKEKVIFSTPFTQAVASVSFGWKQMCFYAVTTNNAMLRITTDYSLYWALCNSSCIL